MNCPYNFIALAIFAHSSRKVTVRLKISFSLVESRSTRKETNLSKMSSTTSPLKDLITKA